MTEANLTQIIVTALLSSGLVGGIITLLTKTVWSPESKNDLARLGNEFAQQLLKDAKLEREELRLTINELERIITAKAEIIDRLKRLAQEKDAMIRSLELLQFRLAQKVRDGEAITIHDIFDGSIPKEFCLGYENPVDYS